MLDWLILGGGLQGAHLAISLLVGKNIARDRIRILDADPEPFGAWRRSTRAVGMRYLRSASVHHIDLDAFSLRRFAAKEMKRSGTPIAPFAAPYDRPSLELFDRHCDHAFEQHRLAEIRDLGVATDLILCEDRVRVVADRGEIEALRVVLALGAGARLRWPEWARDLRDRGGPIDHVYAESFERSRLTSQRSIAVVGAASSASQLALALMRAEVPEIYFIPRRDLHVSTFEVDPGWIGPKLMRGFAAKADLGDRRRAIQQAREPATLPIDVERELKAAIQHRRIMRVTGEVSQASFDGSRVTLTLPETTLTVDRVVLATGYDCASPADSWLAEFARRHDLATGPCGFPQLDQDLAWSRRVHVMGALAELELGPTARNLTGARAAAERLMRIAS